MMSKIIKARYILGTFFILIGAFYLYLSYNSDILFAGSVLEAMDYPRFLIIIWLFLSVLYLVIPRKSMDYTDIVKAAPLCIKAVVTISAYIIALPYAGFICSSIGFLWIYFFLFGDRKYIRMLIISSVSTLAMWFIFEIILKTPLPLGFWADLLH